MLSQADIVSISIGVAGTALGVFFTWLFYHLANRKQKAVYEKLSDDVIKAILDNPNDKLRHEELQKILNDLATGPVDAKRLVGSIDCGTF